VHFISGACREEKKLKIKTDPRELTPKEIHNRSEGLSLCTKVQRLGTSDNDSMKIGAPSNMF